RTKMVRPRHRAWHAGVSRWGAIADVNSHSIGIELVNPGDQPYPEAQMATLEALLGHLLARFSIPPERVVGHACVAPGRKIDPGPKLDWRRLARQGLAVWLDPGRATSPAGEANAPAFKAAARRFGYGVGGSGVWDAETLAVWQAFTARFLPSLAGAAPSAPGVTHLEALAARWPCRDSS
ncbi:MAG: N-acetylmuramoyl-L-alanine amidase, partial [Pseudomonadota bacterium]